MDSLYLETNSLLEHVQRGLASLERSTNPSQAQQVEGHVNKQLDLVKDLFQTFFGPFSS